MDKMGSQEFTNWIAFYELEEERMEAKMEEARREAESRAR
jgi:hypothetical protein